MADKKEKFSLDDLSPRPCEIQVELAGEMKIFRLRKFSLAAQLWAQRQWGSSQSFAEAMNPNSERNIASEKADYIEGILKVLHHLMEDKTDFPTWEDFGSSVGIGPTEILNLERAYLVVIGLSQPIIDKTVADAKKKIKREMKTELVGT